MSLATRFMRLTIVLATIIFLGVALQAMAGRKIQKPIATGKDFYVVFPKATWGNQSVGVLINSPSKQKITVTTPSGAKGIINITDPRTTRYYASQFRIESEPERVLKSEATRIQSPNPISVHGQFGIAGISGTFTAIPVSAWGLEYYAIAPQEGTNSAYPYYPTIYSVPMITIIASHAGTSVTITPTAATAKGHAQGIPYTVTLNEGDVYNVTTQADPRATNRVENPCESDLTGTHVTATWPIGMLCSQSHSTWPCGYNECGDYCVEYIPPVCNWDTMYVVTPSVQRLNDMAGEQLRLVFGHNGTELTVADGLSDPRVVGTFTAGDMLDYPRPLSSAIILRASQPFLPCVLTTKPVACMAGTAGGENWTLGMVVLSGVNQWGDYTPFSSATGSQSIANVCFKFSDAPKLKFNGKPLLQQFPIVKHLPEGYAMIPMGINSGTYNEITGDSGATAGGSIFGFGTNRVSPNGGDDKRVQDPEVIKSFCHPIGVDATPKCNPDVTPPHDTITYDCGKWNVTGMDDELEPPATGLYDIWLAEDSPPDTSFNVQFNPAPKFGYGDSRSSLFTIEVINLLQPAQAALHFRDGAGNEYDTLLVYTPQLVDAIPNLLDMGAIRSLDTVTGVITLHNRSDLPATFENYRLKYGATKNWYVIKSPEVPASPTAPFTVPAHDSIKFYFRYISPNGAFEKDDDTLFVTTCKEFPIAALLGQPKKPAIFTQCYEFGNAVIDVGNFGGDTLTSVAGHGVWVSSVGTDTLHISKISIMGFISPAEAGFPASDFWFGKNNFKLGPDSTGKKQIKTPFAFLPNTGKDSLGKDSSWVLAPQETAFVEVIAHPHKEGVRSGDSLHYAWVQFDNDANHQILDSACLTLTGLAPGILSTNINYGTHLYGTTMDAFFVVRNTGETEFHLNRYPFDVGQSKDSASFEFHQYYDAAGAYVPYDITDTTWLGPHAGPLGLDSVRVPFRFVAMPFDSLIDSINIINSSPGKAVTELKGVVVQPHIIGSGSCTTTDSMFLGGSSTQTALVGNKGTAQINIESITIGGPNANAFSILSIANQTTSAPYTLPFTLQPNENAVVTLTFRPLIVGQSTATVAFVGSDALGRHRADSSGKTWYAWGNTSYFKYHDNSIADSIYMSTVTASNYFFPYDTAVSICNIGFASGIKADPIHLEQYTTLLKVDSFPIYNTGAGPIMVTDITSNSPDVTSNYISFTNEAFPINIPPNGKTWVVVTFNPKDLGICRRNFVADFVIENSTGTPITNRVTARGHEIDMHSYIDTTYFAESNTYPVINVIVDSLRDTLAQSNITGITFEMTHYHRRCLFHGTDEITYNTSGQGASKATYATNGAAFAENAVEDTIKDPTHLFGEQGYFEFNVANAPKNISKLLPPFNLVDVRFHALMGLDTSVLNFVVSKPIEKTTNALMAYVNSTMTPGFITIDSICGLNVSKINYKPSSLTLTQNSPNPFSTFTSIHFSQADEGHVKITVVNSVGDVVATPVDQDFQRGEFEVKFDGKTLPNGLYTYRLQNSSGEIQKQMMLMR